MSDYVPSELWDEVLLRLPAKSLIICTTVCKSWYALITSSIFISKHCKLRMSKKNPPLLLRTYTQGDMKEHYTLHSDDDHKDGLVLVDEIEFPFKTQSKFYYRVVGSVNGLYLLSDDLFGYAHTLIVWNPAVQKYVKVPQSGVGYSKVGPHMFCLGFGFDSVKEDYKIVKMTYQQGEGTSDVVPPSVEVFNLKNQSWKKLKGPGPVYCVVEKLWTQVFMNGAVHWIGFSRKRPVLFNSVILCFDVTNEAFRTMELPKIVSDVNPMMTGVADFRGSLCLLQYNIPMWSTQVTVWVMEEYGVVSSWIKSCTVDLDNGIQRVLGFRYNGEIFLEGNTKGNPFNASKLGFLHLYDPRNKRTKLPESPGFKGSFYVDQYVDSIVLLDKKYDANTYHDGKIQGTRKFKNKLSDLSIVDEFEGGNHPLGDADNIWNMYKVTLLEYAMLKYLGDE